MAKRNKSTFQSSGNQKATDMRQILITVLLSLGMTGGFSQTFTARVLDSESGEPIPYATVAIAPDRGTITNEEGYFSLDLPAVTQPILVSCMGFETLEVPVGELSESSVIELQPAPINLNEVYLDNRIPEAEEIIREVHKNLSTNYPESDSPYQFFYRETSYMNFDQLDMELEKNSDLKRDELENARRELQEFGDFIAESRAIKFLDFNGQFQFQQDTSLLRVERATELLDARKDFTMENLQERAQDIILSHLDSTKTYKVKTGMFKVEDSLSMGDEFSEQDEMDSLQVSYLNNMIADVAGMSRMKEGKRLYDFLDMDAYRYEFLEPTYFDGHYVYAVSFRPRKRRAKFQGTLYIDASTYAVLKSDYRYAKGRQGEKVNLKLLLGVKYVEHLDRGTLIFKQNPEGKYYPYYIQKEYGNYFYLHRNLKFIENGPTSKKVQFDFLLEGGLRQKESLLMSPAEASQTTLASLEGPEKIPVQKLEQYEPTIWQDTQIIAPLEEMKNFRVEK
jgi:hypothetical protein